MSLVHKILPAIRPVFFIILITQFLYSCTNTVSVNENEKKAFINTYVELTLARVEFTLARVEFKIESKKYQTRVNEIYKRNGTNREFIDNFLTKISSRPELQKEIFQSITNKLKEYEKIPSDSLKRLWQVP